MEGIKTYRFPSINHGYGHYGQAVPRIAHLSQTVSKVSSCLIDTPRDPGQKYREHLWTFQQHHRGVQSNNNSLPDIPFRLRSSDPELDDHDSSLGLRHLDSYGHRLLPEGTLVRQLTRARTFITNTDPMPSVREAPFLAKGVRMPFAKSLRLCSRERRNPKPLGNRQNGGSLTERLSREQGSQKESNDVPALKKASSFTDVREESPGEPLYKEHNEVASVSVDINSDNIGHTTSATMNTTLAEILNRQNNGKYYNLNQSKLHDSKSSLVNEPEHDKHWMQKIETKVVDGQLYDNFARTRKPELEKESSKTELKSVKRSLNQKSDGDVLRSAEGKTNSAVQKDASPVRKSGTGQSRKQSKLKQSLSNNKTIDE